MLIEEPKSEMMMTPLLSYDSACYVRLFVAIKKGIVEADKCLENMGFIVHCFNCGAREMESLKLM